MTRVRAGIVLCAVALTVTGCGTTDRRPSASDSLSAGGTAAQAGDPLRPEPGASVPWELARPGTPASAATPSGISTPLGYDPEGLRIEVIMPACIERARPTSALIRTAPGAMIGAAATYSDGDAHNNFWLGVADPRGEYPVAWTPPPQAPLGKGKFLVGAQSDTEGGNTRIKEFTLAAIGGCD